MRASVRLALCRSLAFLALICTLASSPARGDTSVPTYHISRFGNFEYYFKNDVRAPGESYMNVQRIYNSFGSEEIGMFGAGWASFFEVNLQLQDDGSILVHEYGGGANNVFTPTTTSLLPQKTLRDEIMRAAGEVGQFGSDTDRKAYEGMLADSDAEQTTWNRLSEAGLLKPKQPAVGETFFSGRYGTEVITRVPEGYQRETQRNDGTYYEAFDLSGRLTRMWNKNHDYVALEYQNGHVHRMIDNQGNWFVFAFNADGLVASIKDSHRHVARYEYAGTNLLAANVDGNVTRYAYDARNRLVSVTLPDKTSMRMSYNGSDQLSGLKTVDGTLIAYTYSSQTTPTTRMDTVGATTKKPNGTTHTSSSQYYYAAPDYNLVKEIDTSDGVSTQYTYDRDADILTETTAAGTTTNTYDALDRIISKQTPTGSLTQWVYDPSTGRPATITTTTKGLTVTEHFQYDSLGNIIHASDSTGQDFAIVHDAAGRIVSIAGSALQLSFGYPDSGSLNPASISLAGVGSVLLSYAADGSIAAAKSAGGDPVVAKVRTALTMVLGLLKEAGVSLPALPTPAT